ncbi:pitrilysin family protein [Ichthyenterobacterium sp. W332]|uniref:Pitrilysin family protein n=1 Tax=Microcosmobacter mediterraneus TaxID=3075607 RepID=A0ABU2YH83_9FLAO|nr:pitrilysin family protein [Ichthyenterobacterium sp. W332]MDT0557054.1 pitrilysin family protein [Ichthyenterobacterium sp. W332]
MKPLHKSTSLILILLITLLGCKTEQSEIAQEQEFNVEFEKFTLDNGLQVIFHIDRSDPVVAVALTSHVGSAREKEGRTGFAHLFEHLLFLESENLGKGGLDKMSARIGGSGANGSTSRDRTNYYQTVPKDALEKMIWAEADKLGFFINTVTEPVLAKEKQVVKNEKRQSVDNRPYGHTSYVIGKNLYPQGHPYSWTVIGSLEDLQNATLQDVKDFYNRWYVPNNVTLTIAGDFDTEQAKDWVKKYFDEIPRGETIENMPKQPVVLSETKKLYYEDNFARLPQLTLTWPGVYQYHEDSYALAVLSQYLSQGKKAPLYKVLVEDKQVTDNTSMYQYNAELAGQIMLSVTAYDDVDLNTVKDAINEAMLNFEANGISQEDLDRIKAGQETNFYNSLSSVLGKGFQLAQYEIFAGDPGYINEDVKKILAVTPEDVMRVYNTYIKEKHYVATSFVPKGKVDVILEGSQLAEVVEEKIIEGAEEIFDASIAANYEKTQSSFDRSIEPPYGESPDLVVPNVWKDELSSGIKVFGIENNEVPLVQFELEIKGGLLLEDQNKIGVSNLLANLMTKGTKNKTPETLENAIETLGASINAYATDESIVISGNTLSKNYDATMDLVTEILLEPRWDDKEFDLLKQSTISRIQRAQANPNSIAAKEYAKLIYGENHILSHDNRGTETSVNSITMEDLKDYYSTKISPSITKYQVVGQVSKKMVKNSLAVINDNWNAVNVAFPEVPEPNKPQTSKVYFYDVPGAKQSVIRFGYPALAATDDDYYAAQVMNYRLGGGGFASQLTQQLREGKGYTYGIRSGFSGSEFKGPFTISSGVRSNVTYESASLVKEILENYGINYNENDLEVTKGFMIKSNARAFETLGAKLNMLSNISSYGLDDDYAKQREALVKDMTIEDVKALAEQYINPNKMIYLVIGDAETQLDKLEDLGFGKPVLINSKPINKD